MKIPNLPPYLKTSLKVIGTFLQIIGIIAIIIFIQYNQKPKDHLYALGNQYSYAISKIASSKSMAYAQKHYNDSKRDGGEKIIGEYRTFIIEDAENLNENTIKIDHQIGGTFYYLDKQYPASFNQETGELIFEKDHPIDTKWSWYNWLGLRIEPK